MLTLNKDNLVKVLAEQIDVEKFWGHETAYSIAQKVARSAKGIKSVKVLIKLAYVKCDSYDCGFYSHVFYFKDGSYLGVSVFDSAVVTGRPV